MWNGGNQWSGYSAYLSFFRHVAGLDLPIYEKWDHYEKASMHAGPRIMHADFCMVSDRPEFIKRDAQSRPHCEDGPFCRWRDGWELFYWHGVAVTRQIIEFPETLTVGQISVEANAEVRRVMIERYGAKRYLLDSGAKRCHEDDFGTLYRAERGDDTELVMVKVVNSTPEHDGTYKDYFLRVPPTVQTAREAVAWTFGKNEKSYAPQKQT
jgi:hypothetical protein